MLKFREFNSDNDFDLSLTKDMIVKFLHKHLDRFGDPEPDILRSVDYALSNDSGKGGFVLAALDTEEDIMVGALVMNKTGMSGYIPENILVYVAVKADCRGKGYGGQIISHALEMADGDVKLHVEYDNPAKRLYERIGFANKYAEMRFQKNNREN